MKGKSGKASAAPIRVHAAPLGRTWHVLIIALTLACTLIAASDATVRVLKLVLGDATELASSVAVTAAPWRASSWRAYAQSRDSEAERRRALRQALTLQPVDSKGWLALAKVTRSDPATRQEASSALALAFEVSPNRMTIERIAYALSVIEPDEARLAASVERELRKLAGHPDHADVNMWTMLSEISTPYGKQLLGKMSARQ